MASVPVDAMPLSGSTAWFDEVAVRISAPTGVSASPTVTVTVGPLGSSSASASGGGLVMVGGVLPAAPQLSAVVGARAMPRTAVFVAPVTIVDNDPVIGALKSASSVSVWIWLVVVVTHSVADAASPTPEIPRSCAVMRPWAVHVVPLNEYFRSPPALEPWSSAR